MNERFAGKLKISFGLRLAFGLLVPVLTLAFFGYATTARNLSFEEGFFARAGKTVPALEDMSGKYAFDKAHSSIGFRVKHMGLVDVHGYFRDFQGTISYNANDVADSSVEFTAQTKSVDTGVAPRDNHLRTADFFEVEKFPEMSFKSSKVEKQGEQWVLTGDLTMKGVTKTIVFPFEIVGFARDQRGSKMGVVAETVINRRDFGVNYGGNLPSGVPVLADQITVVLQLECNLQPPAK